MPAGQCGAGLAPLGAEGEALIEDVLLLFDQVHSLEAVLSLFWGPLVDLWVHAY